MSCPLDCNASMRAMSPGKGVMLFNYSLLGITRGVEGVFKRLWGVEKTVKWVLMEKIVLLIEAPKKKKKWFTLQAWHVLRDRHACKFGQTRGCQMIIDKDPRAWRSSQDFLMFFTGLSRGQVQCTIKSAGCRGEEMGHFLYGDVFFLARCRMTHFRQQEDHFHKSQQGGREIAQLLKDKQSPNTINRVWSSQPEAQLSLTSNLDRAQVSIIRDFLMHMSNCPTH